MFRFALAMGLVAFGFSAEASIRCAGETYSHTIVLVSVRTVGAVGSPVDVRVRVNNQALYTVEHNEIVQFFQDLNGSRAYVGLGAYYDNNFPVTIRYTGQNYTGDLTRVLRDPNRRRQSGNEMRVWQGGNHEWGDQYRFRDVVCHVELDP